MDKEEKQIVQTAFGFVRAILSYGEPSVEALAELLEIKSGNKKILLEHLKAINNIISDAIKILGE